MTTETNTFTASSNPAKYTYYRDSDGCDDVFFIQDSEDRCILKLHFWEDPDTANAAIAEEKAKLIVAALNLTGGGWVMPPYAHWILRDDKQIASVWGIEDVRKIRPDLTDEQAWEVLRRADHDDDGSYGITRDTLRITARWLFPQSCGDLTSEITF